MASTPRAGVQPDSSNLRCFPGQNLGEDRPVDVAAGQHHADAFSRHFAALLHQRGEGAAPAPSAKLWVSS